MNRAEKMKYLPFILPGISFIGRKAWGGEHSCSSTGFHFKILMLGTGMVLRDVGTSYKVILCSLMQK